MPDEEENGLDFSISRFLDFYWRLNYNCCFEGIFSGNTV